MAKKRMSKSLRKFIRKEKAKIRQNFLNKEDQRNKISDLYKNFSQKENES